MSNTEAVFRAKGMARLLAANDQLDLAWGEFPEPFPEQIRALQKQITTMIVDVMTAPEES